MYHHLLSKTTTLLLDFQEHCNDCIDVIHITLKIYTYMSTHYLSIVIISITVCNSIYLITLSQQGFISFNTITMYWTELYFQCTSKFPHLSHFCPCLTSRSYCLSVHLKIVESEKIVSSTWTSHLWVKYWGYICWRNCTVNLSLQFQ